MNDPNGDGGEGDSFPSPSLSLPLPSSSASSNLWQRLKQRASSFRSLIAEVKKEDVVSYLLFFVMGTSSWMLVNGVYLQIPFFIGSLPEKEAIGAWISIVIQFSNSVAFLLLLFNYFVRPLPYLPTIAFNILLAIITSLLLSFFWDQKTMIHNEYHSVVLLILTFLAAVVGAISVIFYYPFASLYHASLISAVATGMGMTGLIASSVSWVQDKGDGAVRFGVAAYYRVTTFFLLLSLASLVGMVWWEKKGYLQLDRGRRKETSSASPSTSRFTPLPPDEEDIYSPSPVSVSREREDGEGEGEGEGTTLLKENSGLATGGGGDNHQTEDRRNRKEMILEVLKDGWWPGLNQLLICLMNYLVLGVLPYAAISYEPNLKFTLMFHLNVYSMTLGAITRYLSTHFRFFYLPFQTFLQILLFVALFLSCLNGPKNPLPIDSTWLLVLVNTTYSGLYGYEDTMLYHYAKEFSKPQNVEHVTRLVAICNQLGAFIGASIAISLVFAGVFDAQ